MADDDGKDRTRTTLMPIAIVALVMMIPMAAIVGAQAWFPWIVGLLFVLGGGTFAAKYLMDHRHRLRMEELEAQRRILVEERNQLDVANRLLEADDEALRRDLGGPGTIDS